MRAFDKKCKTIVSKVADIFDTTCYILYQQKNTEINKINLNVNLFKIYIDLFNKLDIINT